MHEHQVDLAAFVRTLHALDATDVPRSSRGAPLRVADGEIRGAIEAVDVLRAMWSDALAAPKWSDEWIPYYEHSNRGIVERSIRKVQNTTDDWLADRHRTTTGAE